MKILMKRLSLFAPLILMSVSIAFAKNPQGYRDEICSIADPALVGSRNISKNLEYYFRPFAKSNRIAMTANGKNYFLDLDNGHLENVPGSYDALPLPDEKFWIRPSGRDLQFYQLNSEDNTKMVFRDPEMKGFYQAAGLLTGTSGEARYRVIIDNTDGKDVSGLIFQDYDPTAQGGVKPVHPHPQQLCGNLSGAQSLPMLSKDGKMVSLLDVSAGHTKIYTIDSDSGNCTLLREIPQATGKVDFSFDGQEIAYHTVARMSAENVTVNGWIPTPKADMVANAWTMNLKTGEMKQITHFTDTSALYPAFNAKGQILVRKFREHGSTILTYDPSLEHRSINSHIFESKAACAETSARYQALTILGQLFADLCVGENSAFSPQEKALFILNLDKVSCHRLAQSWESNKAKVALPNVTLETLLSVCPQETIEGPRNQIVKQLKASGPPNLLKTPAPLARCLMCHGPQSPLPMSFDHVEKLKGQLLAPSKIHPSVTLLDEMSGRVQGRSVPPANNLGAKSLTDAETNEVLDWLEALKTSH